MHLHSIGPLMYISAEKLPKSETYFFLQNMHDNRKIEYTHEIMHCSVIYTIKIGMSSVNLVKSY